MRIREQEIPIENTFKNQIIHQYDKYYVFSDVVPYYFDDFEVFKLFMKESENIPKYTGQMIDCEVEISGINIEYDDEIFSGSDIIKNYVKNVGGTVNNISGGIAYINIPTDSPYFNQLRYVIHYFHVTFDRIKERYDLEYKEGKKMPRFREEKYYNYDHGYSIYEEILVTIAVIFGSLLFMIF